MGVNRLIRPGPGPQQGPSRPETVDRKSTRLNSSHGYISYAVFCLKKKKYTSFSVKELTFMLNMDALLCNWHPCGHTTLWLSCYWTDQLTSMPRFAASGLV